MQGGSCHQANYLIRTMMIGGGCSVHGEFLN
jgi:hypothetical protein